VRRALPLVAVGIVAVVAGCSQIGKKASETVTTAPVAGGRTFLPAAQRCDLLRPSDVAKATGVTQVTARYLSPTSAKIVCYVAYFQVGGQAVFEFTEAIDDPALLAQLRRTQTQVNGREAVRSVAGFGQSAFLVRSRMLAVRRGRNVYAFESFLPDAGQGDRAIHSLARLVLDRASSSG